MSNICDTVYKVTGSRKAVKDPWNVLQSKYVNIRNVQLYEMAEHYGINYKEKGISVRGHIYWAEYEEDDNNALLSFNTESSWSSCDLLFEEINKALNNELSISWREIEPGCDLFFTHDENCYFPEECYVTASGDLFEDYEGAYLSISDAIKLWCEKTGISQDGETEQEMTDFINNYEYEDEDTYFNINVIEFE